MPLVGGILISAAFLFLALHSIVWKDFFKTFNQVRIGYLILGVVITIIPYLIVSLRWKILLSETISVSFAEIFSFTMIGYFASTIFPARLGDFGKAVFVGRTKKISSSQVFGTVLLERLMDTVMLLVLAVWLSFLMEYSAAVKKGLWVLAAISIAVIIGVVVLALNMQLLQKIRHWVERKLRLKILDAIFGMVEKLAAGLCAVRQKKVLFWALLLSLFSWLLLGFCYITYQASFQITIPWYAAFFVIVLINLSGIIPSSPGNIGVYEYMVILGFSFWGVDKSVGLSFGLLTHGLNLLVTLVLGGWCLYRRGISLWKQQDTLMENKDAPA